MSLAIKRYNRSRPRNGTDVEIRRLIFKSLVLIFKYIKEPWVEDRKHA